MPTDKQIVEWSAARLREPSTWRGLAWMLTALGITLNPAQIDAIIAVGMAIAGLIGVFAADNARKVEIMLPPQWGDEGAGIEPKQHGDAPNDAA